MLLTSIKFIEKELKRWKNRGKRTHHSQYYIKYISKERKDTRILPDDLREWLECSKCIERMGNNRNKSGLYQDTRYTRYSSGWKYSTERRKQYKNNFPSARIYWRYKLNDE